MNTEALEYRLSQLQAQIDRLERVNAALKQNIAEQQQDFQRMSRELVELRAPLMGGLDGLPHPRVVQRDARAFLDTWARKP